VRIQKFYYDWTKTRFETIINYYSIVWLNLPPICVCVCQDDSQARKMPDAESKNLKNFVFIEDPGAPECTLHYIIVECNE